VEGGGDVTPTPVASIPGAFKANDPGYKANVGTRLGGRQCDASEFGQPEKVVLTSSVTAQVYGGGANGYIVPGPKVVCWCPTYWHA